MFIPKGLQSMVRQMRDGVRLGGDIDLPGIKVPQNFLDYYCGAPRPVPTSIPLEPRDPSHRLVSVFVPNYNVDLLADSLPETPLLVSDAPARAAAYFRMCQRLRTKSPTIQSFLRVVPPDGVKSKV